jgi:carotenoid cleavage dioxygenase
MARGIYRPRWHPDLPSRFAVVPRRGGEVRWFEAQPTYVLHWINAYEDGDEVVLDGFFEGDPEPGKQDGGDRWQTIFRYLDLHRLQARPRRWRFNMATGAVKEEDLSDRCMEFGMINQSFAGRPYRYSYNMTAPRGWFLFDGIVKHDNATGEQKRFAFGDGVFGSETPMAPRPGATAEDDGYLLTFTTDVNRDCSEALVLTAQDLDLVARIRLPQRISSGTHSCWAPAG